jgi:hypothetical protein
MRHTKKDVQSRDRASEAGFLGLKAYTGIQFQDYERIFLARNELEACRSVYWPSGIKGGNSLLGRRLSSVEWTRLSAMH